jgi:WD40 repeat protein
MAREPSVARQDQPSAECGDSKTHRGHVKFHVVGQGLVCLIGAVMVAELSRVGRNPAREDNRMRLAEGDDGVSTQSLAVSPNGSLIATTDTAGRVALREEARGWRTEIFADYHGFAVSIAFTPDGRFLAIGGLDFGIALWDRERDGNEQSECLPQRGVRAMAFSSDGRSLAAMNEASTQIVIWDVAERRERMILTTHLPVLSLVFSPDGRYLSAGESGSRTSIYVWELETGRARLVLEGSSGPVSSIAFSPDGTMLATTAVFERCIRLWDTSSGRLCRVIVGHAFGTDSVAFSPDGRSLASAGSDGMVRLWNAATGKQRAVLDGRANRMNHVAFSPDGRILIATGSGDNHVRFWDLTEMILDNTAGSKEQARLTRGPALFGRSFDVTRSSSAHPESSTRLTYPEMPHGQAA